MSILEDKKKEELPMIIVGSTGEARIAMDIAIDNGLLVYGYLSDKEAEVHKALNEHSVIASLNSFDAISLLKEKKLQVCIAELESSARKDLVTEVRKYRKHINNLISSKAIVSPFAELGEGNLVHVLATLSPNSKIGDFNIIGNGVHIDPDTEIGDYCTLQNAVIVGTRAEIEDNVFIGAGAIIHAGITIGKGALIAPGSVVLKSVEAGTSVYGNPAGMS